MQNRNAVVASLSGGELQRLYFALAIAGDPQVLFLDEPSVGLDVEARHALWDALRAIKENGKNDRDDDALSGRSRHAGTARRYRQPRQDHRGRFSKRDQGTRWRKTSFI